MNILEATKETITLWKSKNKEDNPEHADSILLSHCENMYATMLNNTFSYGKLCRWLGWIQACCVANHCATLEDMKQINKKWANTEDTKQ